jgi:hypothetical protein
MLQKKLQIWQRVVGHPCKLSHRLRKSRTTNFSSWSEGMLANASAGCNAIFPGLAFGYWCRLPLCRQPEREKCRRSHTLGGAMLWNISPLYLSLEQQHYFEVTIECSKQMWHRLFLFSNTKSVLRITHGFESLPTSLLISTLSGFTLFLFPVR